MRITSKLALCSLALGILLPCTSAALFGRGDNTRITRGCRVGSDAVVCKRSLALPTETVFSREPIIHFRSERDNSEGFFPKRSERDADENEPSKASTAKDDRLMTQERHKRQFLPLMSISSYQGGFGGFEPFNGFGGKSFFMTL